MNVATTESKTITLGNGDSQQQFPIVFLAPQEGQQAQTMTLVADPSSTDSDGSYQILQVIIFFFIYIFFVGRGVLYIAAAVITNMGVFSCTVSVVVAEVPLIFVQCGRSSSVILFIYSIFFFLTVCIIRYHDTNG